MQQGKEFVQGTVDNVRDFKEDAAFVVKNRGKRGLASLLTSIKESSSALLDKLGPVLTQEEEEKQLQEQHDKRKDENNKDAKDGSSKDER